MVSLSRQISLISVTGFALLCLATPVWAADGRIQDIRYDAANRHFQINAAGNVKATVNTLNIAGHKRIIIDVDNAEIGSELPRDVQLLHTLSRQLPALKNLTVNQYAGNGRPIVRILFDIEGDPGTIRLVRNQGAQIELEFNESANWTGRSTYGPAPTQSREETPQPTQSQYSDIDLRRTLAIMNQKYDLLSQENQYLKARLSSLEQNSSTQQSQQQSSREEQNRLKSELDRLRAENSNLQTRLTTLSVEKQRPDPALYAKDSEINQLKSENQSLNSRLTAALSASNEASVSAMKQSLAEINRRYDLLVTENQGLKSKLSAQSSQVSGAQTYKAEVDRLSQSYQNLLSENNRLKAELNQSKTAASKVPAIKEADLAALRSQLTTAQSSLGESIQTINQQNKEIAFLRNQINDVKSGLNASSKEQIATLQAELDALRKSAAASKGNSADKQVIAQLTQDKQTMQSELDTLRRSAAASKGNSADKQLIAQLTQEKQSLQSELDTLRRSIAASKGNSADKQLIAQLTQDKQSLQSELDTLRRSAAVSKGNSADKQLIAQLTQDKQTMQSELNTLKASQDQSTSAQQEKSAQLQTQVARLQADLSSLKAQYEKASQEALQAKQALKVANGKTSTPASSAKAGSNPAQQNQIQSLTQQLASLKQENSSLRESLSNSSASNRKSGPTNAEAEQNYQAGKTALNEKKTSVALDNLKKALLLDQDNSKYAVDYSIALAEDHQYAEAIDMLRRYIQRNPGDRDAYNQLGKIYLLNDQPDAANQAFTRAIPVSVLNNYATSLKKIGNNSEAESIFKLALSINPKDSEILFNLGNLYNAENKLEEARNKYLEAIQIRPGFAEAHYNLGLIFSKLGDNPKAVIHLEKYLQLSPNARNAETIRAYMQKLKA